MTAPDPQPPAAPETDVSASDRVQRFLDERARPTLFAPRGFLPVDFLAEITRTGDVLLVSDLRALLADLSAARERLREVESERDAARREERMRAEDHARAWREVAAADARAESAEAAHEALRDDLLALADDFDSNVDWSSGRNNYGDNEAWESAARQVRALAGGAR